MKLLIALISTFSSPVLAKDLVGSINSLSVSASEVATSIGIVGLVIAGIVLATGNHTGKEMLKLGIVGLVVILLAPSIVGFLREVL